MTTSSMDRAELLKRRLAGQGPRRQDDGIPPASRDGVLPVSPGQRGLWILDRIRPGDVEYLMAIRLRISGAVDGVALRRALDDLVARHEILRTRYAEHNGEPVQVIDPPGAATFEEVDLRDLDAVAARPRLDELVAEAGGRPFDLAAEHPIRALLVHVTGEDHTLVLTLHHIASDGWSEAILMSELDALYVAHSQGQPAALAPLPCQYVDFAAWQRKQLSGPRMVEQLDHWRGALAGLAPLDLRTDRPRPPVRDNAGASQTFTVPAGLARTLTDLGRRHGATPFMVLLAAFQVLLGRYSGQRDVAVGTPSAGRDRAETQGLVGLFLTMLTLRADLSGDPTFVELLVRVRETALNAYAHQDVPFERVVDELVARADPSRTPLFQATFQLGEAGRAELPGLNAVREPVGAFAAKFELALTLSTLPDGALAGDLTFATALFDAETAGDLVRHYLRLLEGIAADPETPIGRVALLTEAERSALLFPHGPAEDVPVGADESLVSAFRAQVARTPDAVALTSPGGSLSYAELDARARTLGRRLRHAGAAPGALVGVSLERGDDLIPALLGVLASGAGYLPLDPGLPVDRLTAMVEDAGVRLVVSASDRTFGPDVVVVRPGDDTEPSRDDTVPVLGPTDTAYVIYTSGSTGRPKGVVVSHGNVLRLLRSCADDYGFGADDVWSMFHSYAFDVSVFEMWGALLHGGRLVVVPHATARSPRDFLNLLTTERVTVLSQTPSAFRALTEAMVDAAPDPSELPLRAVVFAGEALDTTDLEPWFTAFGDACPAMVNMYGITETTVHSTYRRIDAAEAAGPRRSPIGRALRDLRLYLLDEHLEPVPVGVPGQIYVGGPGVTLGYSGRPELTADRFGPDPYATVPGERMYRSGDLAYRRRDGELEFVGRVDHQVKIRGFRIEPGEIEAVLSGHPDVRRCLVIAYQPEGERDARLVAYLTAAPGRTVDVALLREHLGRALPGYMVPAVFVPIDEFPVNANGKTDRSALPDPEAHLAAATAAHRIAPRTPLEAAIAAAWATALGVPDVGVHDNFFALGGDSIRAIRVVGALHRSGVEVSVQDVLVHRTVAELAHVAGDRTGARAADDVRCAPFSLLTDADRAALPPDVDDAYPMAMVQAAMVYQMVADPEESPYHNITVVPMADDAPFDLAAFRAAAALLAGRHDVLRTSFDLTSFSEPMQLVHRDAVVEVDYDDVRDLHADQMTDLVARFVAKVRGVPFDLTRAPLLRFHVHQTADDQWSLSFIECHAILDGWSHHSIIAELLADYRVLRAGGTPAPRQDPGVRFVDYVAAEQRSLRAGPDREFWRDRLARHERARLPESWAAAPADEERPHEHQVPIADLTPALRALALAAGVPLKSVLLAAHLKVLGVVSGSRRFHTGLVSNGRLETEGGDLVRGMHLNTLPIAVDLSAATWVDLVRHVFAEEVATWPHRRFPLPEMQREWGGGSPLAEIAFTYLDFHILEYQRGDAHEAVDESPNEFALDVWTFPGVVYLAGRPDRISRANGERLAGIYRAVLESMAADPTGDARGAVLTLEERTKVLTDALGPEVRQPDAPVHELFEEQVVRTPDAVALHCADGTTVGYADLNARANRLARHLRALGVREESRVGVLLRRGPDLVTALLAVLKAGAAYLPLDPGHPASRTAALLAETGAELVLTEPALSDKLVDATARPVRLDQDLTGYSAENLERTAGPESLAYVIYTSGSTGAPKGVLIEHRNLLNYVLWSLHAYTPLGGSGSPLYSSVAFDLPVTSIYPALLSGQAVTITEDDGTPGVDALVAVLERGGFGLLKLTPSHLAVLNQSLTPYGVQVATGRLIAGGEELNREMVTTWAEHAPDTVVDNEYGPTETTVGCSYLEGTAADLAEGVLPIGRPIDNTTMRVLDHDMQLVPVGVTGELYLGGAQLARGYVARPDLTADRFVPDPYSTTPGARLYRSGDLARLRADGVLEFVGRVDGQVKIRGYRIEVGEVEAALRRVAAPRDVAVRANAGADGAKFLTAYLVPGDRPIGVDALPAQLAAVLPQYLIPDAYVVLDAVPMTPSGKIDVAALPAPATSARPYVAPRNALENMLAKAWGRVLGKRTIGIHDSFVELGGHSLVVMRVIVHLRERYDVRASFRDFYLHRTVAQLAAALSERPAAAPEEMGEVDGRDALVWLRREGSRPPLFCIHPASAHWYAALAEQFDDRPVAAFEWPGASRPCPAPETIEQIAELNLAQLRRAVPEGPCNLLGWCGGSQITSEMARRLREEGRQVNFFLLDPALDTHERDNMLDLMATFRRAEELLEALDDAPPDELPVVRAAAKVELEKIVDEGEVDLPRPGDDFWLSRTRVWRELLQTRIGYRHRPYPGHLDLLVGDELAAGEHEVAHGQSFDDYAGRWAELSTGGLSIHRVSGTHLGVLRPPHVAGLAATLAQLLDAAERGTDGGPR
ncbi:non-ribosomal peptide synthetase [Kutzneria sp. CA-103260]|uniref:non-ribosomal peptide synthetase n=1 Tax=Kutzneria sp. CA-103260 TaxID=2802641 RepID=UPI001BA73708|nr:non-ribosomal peptide synthetase [Kutzneria sp. CA-103260]QUQ64546.1 non-ribosomal peptide synthetase [Kutzneria sp. CA-103260]